MTEYGLLKVLAKIAERELQGAKYICQNPDGNWFTSIEKPYFNETWSVSQHIAESEYMGTPTVYEIHAILNRLYIESIESGACYEFSFKKKTVCTKGTYSLAKHKERYESIVNRYISKSRRKKFSYHKDYLVAKLSSIDKQHTMKTSEMKINEAGTTYYNGAWVSRYNKFVLMFPYKAMFVKENKGTL